MENALNSSRRNFGEYGYVIGYNNSGSTKIYELTGGTYVSLPNTEAYVEKLKSEVYDKIYFGHTHPNGVQATSKEAYGY